MAENVLADAQFTLAKVLRPYRNFETVYQNQLYTVPIPFFTTEPNGERPFLDADAGRPGFSPTLLRYVEAPLAARMLLWIPMTVSEADDVLTLSTYTYQIQWRMRNVTDYRNRRKPYHLPKQFPGQPDTTAVPPASTERFILPSATRSIVYIQPEPAGVLAVAQNLRREFMSVPGGGLSPLQAAPGRPKLPGINVFGDYQQGVLDPAAFPFSNAAVLPLFLPWWCDVEGDEYLVTATKLVQSPTDPHWDFASLFADAGFSDLYGTSALTTPHAEFDDLGIYVFVGSNP